MTENETKHIRGFETSGSKKASQKLEFWKKLIPTMKMPLAQSAEEK